MPDVPPIVLPPLVQRHSPNQSSRHGTRVDLLVWHETAGVYRSDVDWLCDPRSQASAHLVVREDGLEATQLVPLAAKAWTQATFNPRAIGVEHSNLTAKGYATETQLLVSARIFGWLLLRYELPLRWARRGNGPGLCYHGELGAAGGNHPNCGPEPATWQRFLGLVAHELERGGYRNHWAT